MNVEKPKTMVVSNGWKISSKEVWKYNGHTIANVKHFQYLGVILTHIGKWGVHTERTKNRSKSALMSIRKFIIWDDTLIVIF